MIWGVFLPFGQWGVIMITVKDYNRAYYLRKPADQPPFEITGRIRPFAAKKASLFADMIEGKRILDVGCGRGEQTRWWAEHGARKVDAIDWSQDAVNIASQYCSHLKNVKVVRADARTFLHTHKHFYHVVFMLDFIEHLTKRGAIKVYKRCWEHWLTPDGFLGVIAPPRNVCKYHLYHQSAQSLRQDIENAKFRIKYFGIHRLPTRCFVVKAQRLRNKKKRWVMTENAWRNRGTKRR